jgi:hypothetical protein
VPAPFSVIVTVVELVKVLPLRVTGTVPQELPVMLLRVSVGPFAHPHETEKLLPVVVQPEEFLTVIEWLPFTTPVNVTPDWYTPPSRLYSIPAPVGPVTVTEAFPIPGEQSIVWVGLAGGRGCGLITTEDEASEVQPDVMATVKLYVPGIRFEIIVVVPVPVIAPGLIVQVPVAGKPLKTTLPVPETHAVGCVIVPVSGAAGVPGGEIITMTVEGRETHPASLVTLNL